MFRPISEIGRSPITFATSDAAGPRGVELARSGQHGVANGLGVEPPFGGTPEKPIVRVGQEGGLVVGRRLAVGARQDDLADQSLHRPAVVHEPDGQMCRAAPGGSARSPLKSRNYPPSHDARAEQVTPDAIDDDAGGERVVADGSASAPARAARFVAERSRRTPPVRSTVGKPRGTGLPGLPTSPRSRSGASRLAVASVTPIARGRALPLSSTFSSCPLMPPDCQKMRKASRSVKISSVSLPFLAALKTAARPSRLFLLECGELGFQLVDAGFGNRGVKDRLAGIASAARAGRRRHDSPAKHAVPK